MNETWVSGKLASKYYGLCQKTLRKLTKNGNLEYYRTGGGHFRYKIKKTEGTSQETVICYCRVSSVKQKDDLARQVVRMRIDFPAAKIIQDIGSGLNFKRKGLKTLLESLLRGNKFTLILSHRDRLVRFGYEMFEFLINKNGGEILVLNGSVGSAEKELAEDILSILHVFSCRMHGRRSHQNKKNKNISNTPTKSYPK